MNKRRVRMKLDLKRQDVSSKNDIRNISIRDIHLLANLMLEAYKDTLDYEGENLEDALSEVQATFKGKYGRIMEDCSFLIERDGKAISASIITWFDEVENPLLAFSMTHPDFKNQGFGTSLLKTTINALMDNGYKELYLVVTEGNEPAEHLYKKIGFQKLPPSLARKM